MEKIKNFYFEDKREESREEEIKAKEEKSIPDLKNDNANEVSRRNFLKRTGAAAIGVAIGGGGIAVNKLLEKDKKTSRPNTKEGFVDGSEFKSSKQAEVKENEAQEITEPNKREKQELKEAEKIALEILRTYNLPLVARRYDPKVFTKDFFMAQQFQESRYNEKAKSSSDAQGVYQNKVESIIEVVEYLDFLRDKKGVDYRGPKEISLKMAEEIGNLFKKNTDYGRAVGKLYLLSIHDKESKYNNGKPNKDVFRGKSAEEQQKLLLLAYHDGPSRRYHPENATKNGKKYVEFVFEHKKVIKDLRDQLEKAGMSRELDYAIIKIKRELDRPENKKNKDETINFWLKKLQDAHIAKWAKTGKQGMRLSNKEIWNIFSK